MNISEKTKSQGIFEAVSRRAVDYINKRLLDTVSHDASGGDLQTSNPRLDPTGFLDKPFMSDPEFL
jgi:hypothetical protein